MNSLTTNWGTSLGGAGALFGAALSIFSAISAGQMPDATEVGFVITGIAAGFGLLKGKDSNVTGGMVSAATGAKLAMPVSVVDERSMGLRSGSGGAVSKSPPQ